MIDLKSSAVFLTQGIIILLQPHNSTYLIKSVLEAIFLNNRQKTKPIHHFLDAGGRRAINFTGHFSLNYKTQTANPSNQPSISIDSHG